MMVVSLGGRCRCPWSHRRLQSLLPFYAILSLLLATLASSSGHGNNRGGGPVPPPGGSSGYGYGRRDGYYHQGGFNDDNDSRYGNNGRRPRDRNDDDSWERRGRRPPMPKDPPPPPPQDSGMMGGYGPTTPLPGATPPPGTSGIQGNQQQPGIHYNFPSTEYVDKQHEKEDKKQRGGKGSADDVEADFGFVPKTDLPPMRPPPRRDGRDGPDWADPNGRPGERSEGRGRADFATARNDAVQRYISTHRLGRLQIMSSSALVGYGLGTFLGQSITSSSHPLAPILAVVFAMLTILRNHYGELTKALGLGLMMTAGRLGKVRRRYPTVPHLKAMLKIGQREPFPPVFAERENVWKYSQREGYEDIDPDFNMMRTALAMALVGGFCGGHMPLIPTWIGGTAGAAGLALGTTLRGAKGDLYRTMGMRVVAMTGEMLDVVGELGLARKSGYTAGKIFDRIMFLDRKHGIRNKVGAGVSWIVQRISSTKDAIEADINEDEYEYEDRGRQRNNHARPRYYE